MILLTPTSSYPCQWDDLLDSASKVVVTIETLAESELAEMPSMSGITLSEDGVYDIVIDVPALSREVVTNALADLSAFTGKQFALKPM